MEISGQGMSGQIQGTSRFLEGVVSNEGKQPVATDGKSMLLNSLEPGSYLYGQVQSSNGESAVLLLENGQKLLAKLMEGVILTPGQNVTFQVETKQDGLVYMKPLFAQAELEMVAGKALKEAGFTNSPKNLEIVKELLERNLPVDKNTIRSMLQRSVTNPEIPVKQLALLEKLGIPATRENLEQLKQYQAGEHQLGKQMDSLMKELGETTKQLLSEGKIEEATNLNQKVLDFLCEELLEDSEKNVGIQTKGTALMETVLPEEQATEQKMLQETMGREIIKQETGESETGQQEILREGVRQENIKPEEFRQETVRPEAGQLEHAQQSVVKEETAQQETIQQETIQQETTSELSQKAEPAIKEQIFGMKEVLSAMKNPEKLVSLLGSRKFQSLLERGMKEAWQIKASEFTGKDSINRTYARMEEQTRILGELLRENGSESGGGIKNLSNVQNNLEFIQDLNQVFPYIQLPLQMAGESAHGDLYVFRDKKKLHEEGEPFTAFLHLAMEHLGDVDVYLSLKGESVSTDITVEKEEILDLFAAHMDEFTDRLEKKGYQVSSSLKVNEKKVDFTEDILAKQAGDAAVSRFSFDVKA